MTTHQSQHDGFASNCASHARQITADLHEANVLPEAVRKRQRKPILRQHTYKMQLTDADQSPAPALADFNMNADLNISSTQHKQDKKIFTNPPEPRSHIISYHTYFAVIHQPIKEFSPSPSLSAFRTPTMKRRRDPPSILLSPHTITPKTPN